MTSEFKSISLALIAGLFYLPLSAGMSLPTFADALAHLSDGWEVRNTCGCVDESCCCGAPCCSPQRDSETPLWESSCSCGGPEQIANFSAIAPHTTTQSSAKILAPQSGRRTIIFDPSVNSTTIDPLDKVPI